MMDHHTSQIVVHVDCNYHIRKRQILHAVNTTFKSGRYYVILGSSGSGKSTLLNILAGHTKTGVSGSSRTAPILVNKEPMSNKHQRHIGYLQHDIALPRTGTVFEYLLFYAMLYCYHDKDATRKSAVHGVLQDLGIMHLADRTLKHSVLTVSCGERRLIAIAANILRRPSLLLLDEPTSGLDQDSIATLHHVLSELAHKRGMIVISTVHQPGPNELKEADFFLHIASGRLIGGGSMESYRDFSGKLRSMVSKSLVENDDPNMNILMQNCFNSDSSVVNHYEMASLAIALLSLDQVDELRNDVPIFDVIGYIEPLAELNLPSFMLQVKILLQRDLKREFTRVYQLVDLIQFVFEIAIQLMFYYKILENKDGPSGAFWTHIGSLFTMCIMASYRGTFTALYGEFPLRPSTRQEILSQDYSRAAYITFRLITTLLVGIPFPCVFFICAMLIQGCPWNGGSFLAGMPGVLLSYLCGQLVGLFSAFASSTFNKSINVSVAINWLQSMPSGSFHLASTLPAGIAWLPFCTFLYFGQAITLVGVTEMAMEYHCNGKECNPEEVYWGMAAMGYNGSYTSYLWSGIGFYALGLITVAVTFMLSKSYRPL